MKPLLSITIPTYNRHECLARTLSVLKPQLRDEVEIVVVDNNSSPSARITVDDIFPQPTNNVRVICNDVNIGLCANILRCFEVASSDRIWVLSDDDSVDALAINTILAHPQESLVDIYSISSRTPLPNIVVDSLTQLLVLLDSWPHLMFISSSVYDRKTLLPYINLHSIARSSLTGKRPHCSGDTLSLLALAGPRYFLYHTHTLSDF